VTRPRHPHAVAGVIGPLLLACVVLGPGVLDALRDKATDGRWELQPGDHGVPAGLVIEVDGGEVTGEGPCNDFRADWSQDSGASGLLSTLMGCPGLRSTQEQTYFGLLDADTVEVEGDTLRLSTGDQTLEFLRLQ
jgi:hypothetical protein